MPGIAGHHARRSRPGPGPWARPPAGSARRRGPGPQPPWIISSETAQRGDAVGLVETGDQRRRVPRRPRPGRRAGRKSVCRNAPSTFRLSRPARDSAHAAAPFAAAPARPAIRTRPPVDAHGVDDPADRLDRDDPGEHEQHDAVDLGAEDLRPPEPERVAPCGGRRARRRAKIARPIAPASVSMWAASESRASESATMPTATSTAMKATLIASATSEPAGVAVAPDAVVVIVAHVAPSRSDRNRRRRRLLVTTNTLEQRHRGAGDHRVQQAGGGQRDRRHVVGEGPEQVALDRAQRAARQPDGVGGRAQVAAHERQVARLDGGVGAGAHGQAEVGLRPARRRR